MKNINQEIIVTTWGIGKSYRERVKYNIRKAVNTGYDKILPYIILTDNPKDFIELQRETNKIVDIIDINNERKKYSEWSFDVEYIPNTDNDVEYSKLYREKNNNEGKKFSYALNRFSLPTISNLGFSKFLMCDSDTDIRYDKIINGETTENNFWEQFNTPINTMKGCDLELFEMSKDSDWTKRNVILSNFLKYYLFNNHPNLKKPNFLNLNYSQTEGPFRYYNLDSNKKVKEVFDLWDSSMKFLLSNQDFRNQISPGVYMYIDNIAFSITNEMLDIDILEFNDFWHTVNVYKSDRYFFPIGSVEIVDGESLSLQPANTKEEFYEINKKLINYYKSKKQWTE